MIPSEIEQFCIKARARIEDMVGRDVMLIPILDFAYAQRQGPDYRKWVLVIEQDGKTWIWDSYTMEG